MDIQQDFYVKKIFYACYVKNVVLIKYRFCLCLLL